jgi:hypothetical protein
LFIFFFELKKRECAYISNRLSNSNSNSNSNSYSYSYSSLLGKETTQILAVIQQDKKEIKEKDQKEDEERGRSKETGK